MPRDITFDDGRVRPVATEEELLSFVNAVRRESGQDFIAELFPSIPGSPEACLIALGVNSSASVDGPGGDHWYLYNFADRETAERVADKLGLDYDGDDGWDIDAWSIRLPPEIGFAALAFDEQRAFHQYAG